MQFILLAGLLLTFLLGCASTPSLSGARIRMADREIRVGDGTFVFRDVILDESTLPGSWIITEVVRNNTGNDWKRVVFDFQLYDMASSVLISHIDNTITTTTYSFNDCDVQPFSTNYFKALSRQDALKSVWKYEVSCNGAGTGKQIFVMIKPWLSRELRFDDQSISITFALSEKQIGLILQNNLNSPIKIDWNNISYVDITGIAHGVIHTGVRYMERDKPQVPTIITPAARIEDAVIPSDHISYTPGSSSGWNLRSLFPAITETDLYIGKSFSMFMPLEFEGALRNYLFSFRIEREPAGSS